MRHWDFYYTTVAIFYLGEQLLGLAFGGLTGGVVVSEMGHLSGAFWGAVIAAVLLKAGLGRLRGLGPASRCWRSAGNSPGTGRPAARGSTAVKRASRRA